MSHYKYDQLNRIRSSSVFVDMEIIENNSWDNPVNPGDNTFNTTMDYDANGNIKALERRGQPEFERMDKLTYAYEEVDGKKVNNQLLYVDDEEETPLIDSDIEDQLPANWRECLAQRLLVTVFPWAGTRD